MDTTKRSQAAGNRLLMPDAATAREAMAPKPHTASLTQQALTFNPFADDQVLYRRSCTLVMPHIYLLGVSSIQWHKNIKLSTQQNVAVFEATVASANTASPVCTDETKRHVCFLSR